MIGGVCGGLSCLISGAWAQSAETYIEIVIRGESAANGTYDPSLEYGTDGVGWMSYSSVIAGKNAKVQTAIARSDDQGRTWMRTGLVNQAMPGTIKLGGRDVKGMWWHEVSTLMHDPSDPGREWKLYWHKYFTKLPHKSAKDRVLSHGWIAYRSAAAPEGPWSDETALFGAGPFPPPPYEAEVDIASLHPDFADYIVLTEPGSLFWKGETYLSFQAVRHPSKGKNKHDVILVASDGASWKGIGVLLKAELAKNFGADIFSGTSLAIDKGRTFLMVTPQKLSGSFDATGHLGTLVFEFEDIASGQLKQNPDGSPLVIHYLKPQLSKGGQADYDEQNTNGGLVMPQFDERNLPKAFRIFNTGERLAAD